MGIPFFFLNCGHIQVFQAQNKCNNPRREATIGLTNQIGYYSHAAIERDRLYLNGNKLDRKYNMIINKKMDVTSLKKLLNELKLIEGEY